MTTREDILAAIQGATPVEEVKVGDILVKLRGISVGAQAQCIERAEKYAKENDLDEDEEGARITFEMVAASVGQGFTVDDVQAMPLGIFSQFAEALKKVSAPINEAEVDAAMGES